MPNFDISTRCFCKSKIKYYEMKLASACPSSVDVSSTSDVRPAIRGRQAGERVCAQLSAMDAGGLAGGLVSSIRRGVLWRKAAVGCPCARGRLGTCCNLADIPTPVPCVSKLAVHAWLLCWQGRLRVLPSPLLWFGWVEVVSSGICLFSFETGGHGVSFFFA